MKIRNKDREGNKILLEVEEDYSVFEESVDKALIEAGKEINIPGFRPGKAPKEMVERAINRDVLETRAAQNLISDLYPKLIGETEIDPVDYPSVEILQQETGKPFVFKISVDVYPEVKLGKYKKLKAEKKEAKVTEEDVVKVLGNLQERFAKTGPDGKKELVPLDDEFAKKISRHGTMAELKEEIREAMLKERVAEADGEVKNKLLAAASAEAKIDIPSGMIEREIDIMLDEFRSSLAGSGLNLEDYLKGIKKEEKTFRDELRKSAEVRVRGKIVLRTVAEAEKMMVTDEEMESEAKSLAQASGQSVEELKKGLSEGSRKYIEDYMLRRKALEFLVENAQIREVKS
jgi:FKBP-type peptidyl-prolyl cis-trans isomerase (trigger factor)